MAVAHVGWWAVRACMQSTCDFSSSCRSFATGLQSAPRSPFACRSRCLEQPGLLSSGSVRAPRRHPASPAAAATAQRRTSQHATAPQRCTFYFQSAQPHTYSPLTPTHPQLTAAPLTQDLLVKIAKKLKKNNVAVDIVSFGHEADNEDKLTAFHGAVNSNDNSHLVTVPPGPVLSDVLIGSPIFQVRAAGRRQQRTMLWLLGL